MAQGSLRLSTEASVGATKTNNNNNYYYYYTHTHRGAHTARWRLVAHSVGGECGAGPAGRRRGGARSAKRERYSESLSDIWEERLRKGKTW